MEQLSEATELAQRIRREAFVKSNRTYKKAVLSDSLFICLQLAMV